MRVFYSLRTAALVALAGGCGLLASGGAASARTSVAMSGVVTPAISKFTTVPQNVKLTMEGRMVGDDNDGLFADTSTRIVLSFTHGARVNGALFPSCDARRLKLAAGNPKACPKGSRIGGGFAFGSAISVLAKLRMDVYNGPKGKSMIFWFETANPVRVRQMIVAPFEQLKGGRYGFRLTLPIPQGLQELTPGMVTSISQFKATVGGSTVRVRERGRTVKRGFIEALVCPPGARVITRGQYYFRDIAPITVDAYLGCGDAPPFPPEFPQPVGGSV